MRKLRGTHKDRKTWTRLEHRVDDEVPSFCTKQVVDSSVLSHGTATAKSCCDGSEFGENDSSSSEDDLEMISWDKLHAESTEDSEWLSLDESLDYLIDFLADEVKC